MTWYQIIMHLHLKAFNCVQQRAQARKRMVLDDMCLQIKYISNIYV